MKAKFAGRFETDYRAFDDNDLALEWCENRWLESKLPGRSAGPAAKIDSYELCEAFPRKKFGRCRAPRAKSIQEERDSV